MWPCGALPGYFSLTTELPGLPHLFPLKAEANATTTSMLGCPRVTQAHPHFLLYVAPALLQAVPDQVIFGEHGGEGGGLEGLLLGRLSCQGGRG